MRIEVIGAGHAGVEAAGQARRHGAEVVLFSGEPVPPYFRPRVVTLACGGVEPDGIHLKPEPWYREQGIELRLDAEVTCVDASAKHVMAGGHEEKFDALVIATGGGQLTSAPEPVAPLLFQHADLELQSIGPSAGADLEETAFSDNRPTVYRSCSKRACCAGSRWSVVATVSAGSLMRSAGPGRQENYPTPIDTPLCPHSEPV